MSRINCSIFNMNDERELKIAQKRKSSWNTEPSLALPAAERLHLVIRGSSKI